MINVLEVTVESCAPRDTLAWLQIGRTRIASRIWTGMKRGQTARIRIGPEDVVICAGHPGRVSARNVLPGHVRSTRFVEGGVAVALDVGFPLTALVTRAAAKDLDLRKGMALYAIVKATVVAPDEPIDAAYRVSLVGANGILTHEKIDFLRSIKRTGSLTSAARDLGVMYRTAWLWAQAANRVWGRPLIVRRHGGKGGGGAALTPQGQAVLKLAKDLEAHQELAAKDSKPSR
ncbi:MAG: LysR family transcriptional regulator [Acidobacteriota bacterium]